MRYDWGNNLYVIGWKKVNLILIFNLHCSAVQINKQAIVTFSVMW